MRLSWTRGVDWLGLQLCAPLLALALPAFAQPPRLGPGEERPPVEDFAPDQAPPSPLELPPIPPPMETGRDRLSTGRPVFVRAFEIEGSTVFAPEELSDVIASYTGRAITSEELLDAKEAITAYYRERGYVTSGAVIPDQAVEDGVVRIRVVEGVLTDVRVEGTQWFRPGYFRDRLLRAGRAPVDAARLERVLQRFQRNARVERIRARLAPGARRGESILLLEVQETRRAAMSLVAANDEPPGIGAESGRIGFDFPNLIGYDDIASVTFTATEGLRDTQLSYEVPLNAADTRLGLEFRHSQSDVVELPIEVTSESRSYRVTLRHPLLRDSHHELWLGLTGERRDSETRVLGARFAFPPTDDSTPVVSVLRFAQDWTYRSRADVVAARSTLSLGLDVLGATTSRGTGAPDGEFVAWLGQIQWVHRFSRRLLGAQVLFRADAQLADDPLLSLEKFAVGGGRTVRGYRENQLVRDNAVVASLELRVPVLRDAFGRPLVQLATFADFGRGWDEDAGLNSDTLASLGLGLRLAPWEWLGGELYWGRPLTRARGTGDLQDHGIHFRLTVTPFGVLSRPRRPGGRGPGPR